LQADPEFIEKLKTDYLSEVLTWFVRGAVAWYDCGQILIPPASVQTATLTYLNELDSIGQFISDMCVFIEGVKIDRVILFRRYENWCVNNNQLSKSPTQFYAAIGLNKKIKCVKIRGDNCFKNITLAEIEDKKEEAKKSQFVDDDGDNE